MAKKAAKKAKRASKGVSVTDLRPAKARAVKGGVGGTIPKTMKF
jgi:hypothetical protein